ncbi:MAG: aldo/keto reductase family protein [Phototrophicaceae bacterium]
MKYRQLGNAGMRVSAVSLGGWINFGEDKVEEARGREIVETAYDNGINFFDLADIYGKGKAESEMGAVLSQYDRHSLVISSKVYWPMSDGTNDTGLSRKHVMESIDKSLDRLQTDYLDIYFCHRYDENTPIREVARTMNDLIEMGKVHYWGTSEWPAIRIQEAYEICDRYGWHLPQVEQPQYSMLYRERVEDEILPVTNPRGIGIVPWSPLAMGMLTGKYDEGVPEDSRFGREEWAKKRFLNDDNAEKVRQLKPIADELDISRAQLALAWLLRHPLVSSVITGATKTKQVLDNIQAVEVELSDEQLSQIDSILSSES